MATNKFATIRYHALDRCFGNFGRKYFMEDLLDACNEAIYEYAGIEVGVKRRQLFEDIAFMESEQGWSVPLERYKDGKRVFYRYADKNYSIKQTGINQGEAEQLKESLSILSRFKGLPQFEWIEEMQIRLEDTFKLKNNVNAAVGFEQNPYLKGLEHFTPLFNAIQHGVALQVTYQSFKQTKALELNFHPWYLKQYNNRWFVFGWHQEREVLSNLALDRIIALEQLSEKYIANKRIDFDAFFDDVVGVSVNEQAEVERLRIRVDQSLWPYIESKPLHGSQKLLEKGEDYLVIGLELQINHELMALLFSYMDGIEVLAPEKLRISFKNIVERLHQKYN
jgi:predicted DNA-binding transcriptional regulator YafY